MHDLALLTLRLTIGGLLTGHGAQKLFGWFGGHGLKGTGGWMESMGLRPGHLWASLAGLSEFGGGTLTALGLFNPLGPIGIMAAMTMAAVKAHGGKPIWVTEGGAEFPLTNMSVALALALSGPGRYSMDRAIGLRLPATVVALALAAAATGLVQGLGAEKPEPQPQPVEERAGAEEAVAAGVA